MPRLHRALYAALFLGLGGTAFAGPALAQVNSPAAPAFLTVDQDRLYTSSLWGKQTLAALEKASADLQAENRKIEAALTAEEKSLTDRRPTIAPDEFRKLADDFDTRVTGIRQAHKARDLTNKRDEDRRTCFDAALPIMGLVMTDRGAIAILDSRAIFLSVKSLDATADMVKRVDEKLGAGPAKPPNP